MSEQNMPVTEPKNQDDGTPAEGNSPKVETKFSQSDLDNIVQKRLAAERAKFERSQSDLVANALAEFRAEHGLDDEVLAKVAKSDQTAAEIRKLKAANTRLQNQLETAETMLSNRTQKLTETLTSSALMKVATKESPYPDQVWLNLKDSLGYDENYNVFVKDAEGNPSDTTINDLVKNFLTEHSYLANPLPIGKGGGSGPSKPTANPGNKPDFSDREARLAHVAKAFGKG
jgi:hypothetical protein